jgi:type IV pilus assembly protein PilC
MMIVVMIAMMVFVVPKLTAMFDDFGTDLPVATKLLIGLSGFLQRYILIFIGLFVGAVYGLKRWYTTKIGRERIDTFLLRIPVYGNLTTQVALAGSIGDCDSVCRECCV